MSFPLKASSSRSLVWPTVLVFSAAIMLIPANVLPVMHLAMAGTTSSSTTILAGVATLGQQGLWPLAAIVFFASILVPLFKLGGLSWLILQVRSGAPSSPRRLTRLYSALDFIGRWSMLDVFLVAFLSGSVRFGHLAHVDPRPGILAFAAAVVLTMLATQAFDPRLIWMNQDNAPEESQKL